MTLAPNLVLAGFQKCGSTFLARLLEGHPQIDLPDIGKEPHIFLRGNETEYPALFSQAFGGSQAQYRCDATVNYACSDSAMARAAAWCPETARIVLIMRDPVERVISGYLHLKKRFAERRCLSEILDRLPKVPEEVRAREIELAFQATRAGTLDLFRNTARHDEPMLNALYVSNSLYGLHLDRLTRSFPEERIALVLFEDLLDDPESTMRRLEVFLGLPPAPIGTATRKIWNRTMLPSDVSPVGRTPRWGAALTALRARLACSRSRRVTSQDFPEEMRRQIHDLTRPQSRRLFERMGRVFEGSSWDHEGSSRPADHDLARGPA